MPEPLYHHPEVYRLVFAQVPEEETLFAELSGEGPRLDAACGCLPLAGTIGVDLSLPMLRVAGAGAWVCCDLLRLPFGEGSFHSVVSRLFGIAYAAGAQPGHVERFAAELGRVLRPDGVAVLELPVAHRPKRVQGLEESAELRPGLHYRFRYLDELQEIEWGSVLATRIEVEWQGSDYLLEAPLLVYTPEGVRRFLRAMNMECRGFFAPYDPAARADEPPADVLRAVVWGGRSGGR